MGPRKSIGQVGYREPRAATSTQAKKQLLPASVFGRRNMMFASDWLHFYCMAKVCRRERLPRDVTISLLSFMKPAGSYAIDNSRNPHFFGLWKDHDGVERCVWDDMWVIRESSVQSEPYLHMKQALVHGLCLNRGRVGYLVSAECPW